MKRSTRPSANATREKILLAAKSVFLEKGFDAAYIKTIAEKAKVNTNLIFHHFGDKLNLWQQVKQSILAASYLEPQYDLSSAKSFFSSLIEYRFQLYGEYPDLVRLLQWQEVAANESELVGTDVNSPNAWLPAITSFQKNGQINQSIDAQQIMLFIIFSTHAPFWQNVFSLSKAQKDSYQSMLLKMCYQHFLAKES